MLDIITINQSKYIFISAGTNAILTIISEENTPDQRLKVYGFHVAKKIELYIDEKPVDIEIPQYIEVLANMRQDSIPTGQFKMKIAIIGDPGVGKKSFVNQYIYNTFDPNYIPAIDVSIENKTLQITPNCQILQSFWIITIIHKRNFIRKAFYEGAQMIFIFFDVTQKNTFDRIEFWINDVYTNLNEKVPIVLIANKIDSPDQQSIVRRYSFESRNV